MPQLPVRQYSDEQFNQSFEQKITEIRNGRSWLKEEPIPKTMKSTTMGSTVLDVMDLAIKTNKRHLALAPDYECFRLFPELFNPFLAGAYSFYADNTQPLENYGDEGDRFPNLDPDGEFIRSTRIRLCRSLRGYRSVPYLDEKELTDIENTLAAALTSFNEDDTKGSFVRLAEMNEETKTSLAENHLLFGLGGSLLTAADGYRHFPVGRGIFYNSAFSLAAWTNEEDHLRMMSIERGGDVNAAWSRLVKAIKLLQGTIQFARDDRLGWLTFCPSNLGTTVRASVHIKVPRAILHREGKAIISKFRLQVRGSAGEDHGIDAEGFCDVSNRKRLGLTEFEAIDSMYVGVASLIDLEKDLAAKAVK